MSTKINKRTRRCMSTKFRFSPNAKVTNRIQAHPRRTYLASFSNPGHYLLFLHLPSAGIHAFPNIDNAWIMRRASSERRDMPIDQVVKMARCSILSATSGAFLKIAASSDFPFASRYNCKYSENEHLNRRTYAPAWIRANGSPARLRSQL